MDQLQNNQNPSTDGGGGGQVQGMSAPAISLPKGGGAIRGIGEKFGANPVTGTGSLTVPIYTSPGRSGFGPQLSLSYDSGAGNGPFGFGWSLSLPSFTRKTDKGLPQYRDKEESDEFILSGAEDLVPSEDAFSRTVDNKNYAIQRYRPRIEGLFARIERWTNSVDPADTFWRSISKDNITTWYGKSAESRIADPSDPTHIFSWLISESYDDKGNVIVYRYKAEDSTNVPTLQAHEKNRTDDIRKANRYLKTIRYGNHKPYLPDLLDDKPWPIPPGAPGDNQPEAIKWFFEVVFDYREHDLNVPTPVDAGQWELRHDPYSSYRAGFEVRTYRLCQRVLMFHHFPDEEDIGKNCLVRSTDFAYLYEQQPGDARDPIHSTLVAVSQSGYKRKGEEGYLKKSLPALEFQYSRANIDETVRTVDPESQENLPYGLDNTRYQWVDLDGEGLTGILTEQAEGWFYKANLSPVPIQDENGQERVTARFGPAQLVAEKPSLAAISSGRQQLLDLAGDGQQDVVALAEPTPGFYERTHDERWASFRTFESLPNLNWSNPNLKFVDLTGDGHADVLISEDDVFYWFPSLAEAGFGPPERIRKALEEEKGPRLVFNDGTQSIYLSDMSGDGLIDIARIRNGEVCYWPNLGYGCFGAKVSMDDAPRFDAPDVFDQRRIRLADIDGTGVTDIVYLCGSGVQLYFNQSGNSWSAARILTNVPATDDVKNITVLDLFGTGTAYLLWSSPLPGDAGRQMRYIALMSEATPDDPSTGQKPHLLISVKNNLGAETHIRYAPSTKFYLQDKREGKPWITKIPFPVHVVERVKTYDRISKSRFVTRYAYHHGYFDGIEREFRGFGMVEQWDTEEFAALTADGALPAANNIDEASHVPPVLTRTWFHTGAYLRGARISLQFKDEYYQEPGLTTPQHDALLLPDTVLPPNLSVEEEREACRALKGTMLRQEVYALDGTNKEKYPYTVTEQNFTVRHLQSRGQNRHAVFFTHAREAISYHYERNPTDPRISHALTLEVDVYGNVLKDLAVGYGRSTASNDPALTAADKDKQTRSLITYTENSLTNPINDIAKYPDAYRTPLQAETRTYELTGFKPEKNAARFSLDEWTRKGFILLATAAEIPYEKTADTNTKQKRLIEQVRVLYRKDDLTALLHFGKVEPLALPGETYTLVFTPSLLDQIYKRRQAGQPDQSLLPANLAQLLGGKGADEGGYVEIDGKWWIPTGRVFYSDDSNHTTNREKTEAQAHFYLPRRYRDPFGSDTTVVYDGPPNPAAARYNLLVAETTDALDNTVTATNDYRVLQPRLVTDANRNRTAASFDALGLVVATAVMGKANENLGDLLEGFDADPPLAALQAFLADPQARAASMLGKATTRIVYDLGRYGRADQPPFAATLARETHAHEPGGAQSRIQLGFSYSDGFGREIQQKIQAEAGNAPQREAVVQLPTGDIRPGDLQRNAQGHLVDAHTTHRWVGTGRTVFNNKGKPVRQYEPFFSATHLYEPEREMTDAGVSPVLFYDPVERVIATLQPNHTYEKVVFDPWQQTTYDVNDTVAASGTQTGDPRTDPDIAGYVGACFKTQPATWQTWYAQRKAKPANDPELDAAKKTAAHANTPTVVHLDVLGRSFLTLADNGPDPAHANQHLRFATRIKLDIEGNQRAVIDARDRVVMHYDCDIAGPQQGDEEEGPDSIHQASMEAGERWVLNDVAGNPIRAWDSRGHTFRTEYDPLRRPLRSLVTGADPDKPNQELLTERLVYGEQHPEAELRNLRGTLFLHLDPAGVVTTEAHDFKGNPLRASRRIATEYKQAIDWNAIDAALPAKAKASFVPATLEAALALVVGDKDKAYASRTTYDAFNRPVTLTTPHTPVMQPNVIRPGYNAANLLERVEANLHSATANGQPIWTPFVTNIDYDTKGQRQSIDYGNGVSTSYEYDPLTFRLVNLLTRGKAVVFPDDYPQPPPAGWPGCQVQNLFYTYDPVGNITHIRDDAQQTIFFKNQRVEPSAQYTYDAIYRLIEAKGREHLGQAAGGSTLPPKASNHTDSTRVGLLDRSDGKAMGRYIQKYVYDEVGNILEMIHRGIKPVHPAQPGWTRSYKYKEESLLEQGMLGKENNRLTITQIGNGPVQHYTYDEHGNMTSMPHLSEMSWDYQDQLQATARQVVNNDTLEKTFYVYDADGERVRKVTERQNGTRKAERIYLGGFEIYREYGGDGKTVTLERETLHVMDDAQRIALVETRTQGNDDSSERLIRYQLGNHLGSASVELRQDAKIISYEEFYPYGSTSYQAVDKTIKAVAKRYRYTGKERDDESGFYYFGARYYAAWLGRWVSCDQTGPIDDLNVYVYTRNNPIVYLDPNGANRTKPNVLALGRTEVKGGQRGLQSILTLAEKNLPGFKAVSIEQLPGWADVWNRPDEEPPGADLFGTKNIPGGDSDVRRLGREAGENLSKYKGAGSSIMVQQVLEGSTDVTAIHFDVRDIDISRRGHTASELRTIISSVESKGNAPLDIHILSDKGLSTLKKGASKFEGAPLPVNVISKHRRVFRAAKKLAPSVVGAAISVGTAISLYSSRASASENIQKIGSETITGVVHGFLGAGRESDPNAMPQWNIIKRNRSIKLIRAYWKQRGFTVVTHGVPRGNNQFRIPGYHLRQDKTGIPYRHHQGRAYGPGEIP